jgi:hypothetical protein
MHHDHLAPASSLSALRRGSRALLTVLAAALAGCASTPPESVQLPLLRGWFEGAPVFYVTTDVSDAQVARDKKANHAPRLAAALPPRGAPAPGVAVAFDKVYAVTNFAQGSIFASIPQPIGPGSRDRAYSPIWRMVTVTWNPGHGPRLLTSEEQVLAASDAGAVRLGLTDVLLNCPIVHLGAKGGLDGVRLAD